MRNFKIKIQSMITFEYLDEERKSFGERFWFLKKKYKRELALFGKASSLLIIRPEAEKIKA